MTASVAPPLASSSVPAVSSSSSSAGPCVVKKKEYWSSDESGGSDAETLREAGNFFFKKKRFEKAISHFTKAIELDDGHNSKLYSNRAMCFNAREEYRKAADDARLALTVDASNGKAYYQGCKALFSMREFADCQTLAQKGLAVFSDDQTAGASTSSVTQITPAERASVIKLLTEHLQKAQSKLKAQLQDTVDALDKEDIAKLPQNAEKRKFVAEGRRLYSTGDLTGAISEFEQALRLNPFGATKTSASSNPAASSSSERSRPGQPLVEENLIMDLRPDLEAHEWMAKSFMRMRRPKEAYDVFKAQLALRLKIEDQTQKCRDEIAEIYSNLGIAAKQSGNLPEAVEALKNALNTTTKGNEQSLSTPLCAQILQNLGQIYRASGEMESARDAYQRSLEIYLRLHGSSHGCVALGHLCLARLPSITVATRKDLYDKVLGILDTKEDKKRLATLLQELPEVPSVERLAALIKQIQAEKAKLQV
ncbi:unnamed protein product [Amoebophrya sp. A25]|nr:unnamed protein product [Amoebophrya sp. A25]|eukprot:GSA25T00013367001.1